MIQNLKHVVPSRVFDLFMNCVPFGSDFIIYTKEYSQNSALYELVYREPVTHVIGCYQVSYLNGDYILSSSDTVLTYEDFQTEYPYYCYSSLSGQGVYLSSPYSNNINSFLLFVIASLLILKTVFGGIKIWSDRKKS